MNCLDYRRSLLAGEGEDRAMKEHRLQCTACAAVFAEHAPFERELRRGFAIPMPPEFEQRLASAIISSRRRFLAAAAIGTLAIGAGGYAWLVRPDPLALACIEFVLMQEANSLLKGSLGRAEAEQALAPTLAFARLERIGEVRHVLPCPFNGQTAYHVIMQVPQGKVTLLVMPEGSAAGRAKRAGLYSSVVPLPKGSLGIVGADAEVVESVAGALRA
jgi:uncharacterized protein DUF3379